MRTKIIKIGNSQGVRIPKALLEQTRLTGEIDIRADGEQLILRAAQPPRAGWEERFRAMAEAGEDQLLDGDTGSLTEWDETEWQW